MSLHSEMLWHNEFIRDDIKSLALKFIPNQIVIVLFGNQISANMSHPHRINYLEYDVNRFMGIFKPLVKNMPSTRSRCSRSGNANNTKEILLNLLIDKCKIVLEEDRDPRKARSEGIRIYAISTSQCQKNKPFITQNCPGFLVFYHYRRLWSWRETKLSRKTHRHCL